MQKHAARRLHYDFRLEFGGVLKSWAVPKGPSLDPQEKSLAVAVEDHPLEYAAFEGIIPAGEYGGGTVMVWDEGLWRPARDPAKGLAKGRLDFQLEGKKLRGGWHLVRMRGEEKNWLLIKQSDVHALRGDGYRLLDREPLSVVTGRSLEEIADAAERVWEGDGEQKRKRGGARKKSGVRGKARSGGIPKDELKNVAGARAAAFPHDLSPQLATATGEIPEGDQWLHELKLDGYRLLAFIQHGKAKLVTRRGNDWTDRFPATARAASRLTVSDAVLDGELVALDERGISSFQQLQNWVQRGRPDQLVFYAFDLPYLDGSDLQKAPLIDRKQLLSRLILSQSPDNDGPIRYSDHIRGRGPEVFSEACRNGLEGVISKRYDSPYESRRTRTWLKTKCHGRQEFVIGGYTRPTGSRTGFGALLLGYYDGEELTYCGKVGTGFTDDVLKDLSRRLARWKRPSPPFVNPPSGSRARGVTWVEPRLVAEVRFTEWTDDGILRQPSFQGLREDKSPQSVTREPAAPAPDRRRAEEGAKMAKSESIAGVALTHPERVLYPDQGVTKRQLAEYYAEIAEWMLPHVVDRPLTLVRCPQGRTGSCFYQKHWTEVLPDAIDQVLIEEKATKRHYVVIHDLPGLISLVQLSVLEVHPWGSRIDRIERPDRIVFDLDPGEGVDWAEVRLAAVDVRDALLSLGLTSFARTSGGKGMHVVVPIVRRNDWDEVKGFAHNIASGLVRANPERYVGKSSKAIRKGKIFIDYLRNARGATAVASYSTRAHPGAPVATPVRWDELDEIPSARAFDVAIVPSRLRELKQDPWEQLSELKQSLSRRVLSQAAELAST